MKSCLRTHLGWKLVGLESRVPSASVSLQIDGTAASVGHTIMCTLCPPQPRSWAGLHRWLVVLASRSHVSQASAWPWGGQKGWLCAADILLLLQSARRSGSFLLLMESGPRPLLPLFLPKGSAALWGARVGCRNYPRQHPCMRLHLPTSYLKP